MSRVSAVESSKVVASSKACAWRTRFTLAILCGAVALGLCSRASAATEARYAVLVGSNVGNDKAHALRYAEEDVNRLSELLKRTGDFREILLIRGGTTEAVQSAFQQMQSRMLADKSAGRSTMFFFYYSGHGDNEALELGATRLPLRYLREHLEAIAADVRVAFVDACHSGAMTGVKGAHRAPAYEVHLADPGRVHGLAIITSSTSHEFSQESDDLKASFFSHSVLSGLLGAADTSGDGQVTLGELYQYAFRRTLSSTAASLTGGQHPTYDYRMVGTGDVVLAHVRQDDARLVFPSGSVATYVVLGRDEVVAEVASSTDDEQYLAVPSGSYQVLRRSLAGIYASTVKLSPGASVKIEPASMVAVHNAETVALMGRVEAVPGFDEASVGVTEHAPVLPASTSSPLGAGAHRFAATAELGSSPWPGVSAATAWGLAYRHDLQAPWTVGLQLSGGRSNGNDAGYHSRVSQLELQGTVLRALVRRSLWNLGVGAFAGVPWVRQTDTLGISSSGAGFVGGATGEASLSLWGPWWMGAGLRAGTVAARIDGSSHWHPLVSGGLLVGAGF